jgi:hypothetical protein
MEKKQEDTTVTERVEVSESVDETPEETSETRTMNLTVWLACIALGLSYTTAIQQQASTASIVKHIDIALGAYIDRPFPSLITDKLFKVQQHISIGSSLVTASRLLAFFH